MSDGREMFLDYAWTELESYSTNYDLWQQLRSFSYLWQSVVTSSGEWKPPSTSFCRRQRSADAEAEHTNTKRVMWRVYTGFIDLRSVHRAADSHHFQSRTCKVDSGYDSASWSHQTLAGRTSATCQLIPETAHESNNSFSRHTSDNCTSKHYLTQGGLVV